ncbi:MAG: HAD family phosphatase [Clostridia bacterium]|nr:HAD family phosphatase [Clostridia bacterium]
MKKFENILICTDLDGTLLKDDKSISRENLEAIEYFKSEGGYFTFITGRPPVSSTDIYQKIKPNAPFGCLNGGGLYDGEAKEYVWYVEMSRTVCDMLDAVDSVLPTGIQVSTLGPVYFCKDNSAMEEFRRITGVPNLAKPYREIEEPFGKIVFADLDTNNIRALASLLASHPRADEFDYVSSEPTLYEILPKGINKGSVFPKLVEYLGIDPKRTVAIGDYDNDVGMLRAAHVGVAVANSSPAALAAADRVTVSNEEHAIARLIHDIESGEIRFEN